MATPLRRDGRDAHPDRDHPAYRSTALRHPRQPLVPLHDPETELARPFLGAGPIAPLDHDLTAQRGGQPLGERIVVTGRVRDGNGAPLAGQLVEVWQANASGRYAQAEDRHDAPLDPNFAGVGRCLTDAAGTYRFVTVKPGPYPWRNHDKAWRPSHIHFSLFGTAFASRLITQMYFPGDPLFPYDPVMQSVTDEAARERMVAAFDLDATVDQWATGYRWDIVLRGPAATVFEDVEG
ncbi:protocatechuate 3,4-dioxygenase subunit beta [Glycomyces harbinensis]|uniref:Protocatechuate 3,4-dioxygenase beta subunit n=1 Tax=Glycomyces harbinensis TaxID=58114 RepID=A0A1G6W391_9ACTN|nr:protocatechuate 3,4-dioxygenase subunit beta [Glycomyces harbinensis]SDD60183.1 protocatechuate 3,4-dioxygenase beta subunit [Glycomyces harbinensis]